MSKNTYTGYKATQKINEAIEAEGFKAIPPQMVYQYISKGRIETVVVDGKNQIEEDVLTEWIEKYIEAKHERAAKKAEKLEAELNAA